MTYAGPDGRVERRVEPLGLVLKADTWYLVARRDHLLRTYRVSRILGATCLPARFERPEAFDLASHWEATATAFEATTRRLEMLVRVRADAIDDLEYATGADVTQIASDEGTGGVTDVLVAPIHGDAAVAAAATDRWVRARFRSSSIATAHDDLLRLGARVEVLAPLELRERLAATVRLMSTVYHAGKR